MSKSIYSKQSEVFRKEIVQMRKKAGLSQRDLAQLLDREHNYVARIEVGERRVDIVELYWICRACKASPLRFAARLMRLFAEKNAF
jgi:transcriptional regulator with XRE-family HTH domain